MADTTRPCEFCGAPAAPRKGKTGCHPKYCGPSCRAKAGRRARGEVPASDPTCIGCNKPIPGAQANRRTCSRACHHWVKRNPGVLHPTAQPRHCKECGVNIDHRDVRSNFCSPLCRERNYSGSEVGKPRLCDQCGKEFLTKKKSSLRCSDYCSKVADYVAHRDKYAAQSAAGRARRREARVEVFLHEEIFERDEWTCYLCGELTDRTVEWPHPLMPSIDHVVPIAKGGEHSRANVRCAHLGCNLRKGTKLLEAV